MKKIFSIILLGFTVVSFAQSGPAYNQRKSQFTPEQQAIIQTKQMALKLDLNSSQQKQLLPICIKRAEEHQTMRTKYNISKGNGKTLTQDERFKMKNEMLDTRLAHQAKVKKILNTKQFDQWLILNQNMYRMKNKHSYHKQKSKKRMKNI